MLIWALLYEEYFNIIHIYYFFFLFKKQIKKDIYIYFLRINLRRIRIDKDMFKHTREIKTDNLIEMINFTRKEIVLYYIY